MKFYFADSQDLIDPNYDFVNEAHRPHRVRQREDAYPHEALAVCPYDGVLISKAVVDGVPGSGGRYTIAQRLRLRRSGARAYFRLAGPLRRIATMGDCGAFSYVEEAEPPFSVADVVDFYEESGVDAGVSVDHLILAYDEHAQASDVKEWRGRQDLTLELASDFLRAVRRRRSRFEPVGVAQGWDPVSYQSSVSRLVKLGYRRIALGGMAALNTERIVKVLTAVSSVRDGVPLHLLGVTRIAYFQRFRRLGVTSFDTTSPLRQSFMDDGDNYYSEQGHYMAVRVPPSDDNAKIRLQIRAGRLDQGDVQRLEAACLKELRLFDKGRGSLMRTLDVLAAYAELLGDRDRTAGYRRTLVDAPWRACGCGLCSAHGVEIAIFRGAQRNIRRGFHNLYVFGLGLQAAQRVARPA